MVVYPLKFGIRKQLVKNLALCIGTVGPAVAAGNQIGKCNKTDESERKVQSQV